MRAIVLGVALAGALAANVASAQTATIYLDCSAKDGGFTAVARTWVVDPDAGTVDPVGEGVSAHYRRAQITSTKIEGTEQTEAGNLLIFDLDRVSGLLRFTWINRALPAREGVTTSELVCRALDKPRI